MHISSLGTLEFTYGVVNTFEVTFVDADGTPISGLEDVALVITTRDGNEIDTETEWPVYLLEEGTSGTYKINLPTTIGVTPHRRYIAIISGVGTDDENYEFRRVVRVTRA